MNISGSRGALRWLLAAVWAGAICWLSLIPAPPVLHHRWLGWDKLQHAAAFGLLTLLIGGAMTSCRASDVRCWGRAVLLATCFGALIELLQGVLTRYRSAEFGDLAADLVGALDALATVAVRARLFARRS